MKIIVINGDEIDEIDNVTRIEEVGEGEFEIGFSPVEADQLICLPEDPDDQ